MVIPNGVNIPMPRPHGGQIPVITSAAKQGEGEAGEIITVQLGGVIGPITQFLELLDVFDTATENDEIVININTPGGDVYTTMTLVERMENCKAKVITVASGLVASAGTFLWFYGKERRVNRWARFLFHCSSHGDFGRSLQIQETATKLVKFMKEIGLQLLGAGIINHAEYVAAFENKADVELSGATIRARLAKAFKAEAAGAGDGAGDDDGGDGGEGGGDGSENGGSLNDNPDEGDGATPALKKKKQKLKKRRKGEADGGAGAGEGDDGAGDAGDGDAGDGADGDQGGEGSTTLTDAFSRILSENDIENPAEGGEGDSGSDDDGAGDGDDGSDDGDDGAGDGEGDGDQGGEGGTGVEGRCGKKGKKKVKKGRRAEAGDSDEAKPEEKGDTEDDLNEDAGIDNDDVEGPKFDPAAILAENGLEVPDEGTGDGDDDEGDDDGDDGDDDDECDGDDCDDAGDGEGAGSVEARRKKKSSKKRRCK